MLNVREENAKNLKFRCQVHKKKKKTEVQTMFGDLPGQVLAVALCII